MTPRTWLLLSWIVVGAIVLIAHAALVWLVIRSKEPPGRHRWWALIPLATPFFAFRDKRWVALGVWAGSIVTYLVLRLLEG